MANQLKFTTIVSKHQLGKRLDQALVELFTDYSRSNIKRMILDGNILVNGNVWDKPKKKVLGGEVITINNNNKEIANLNSQNIPFLNIIYEDEDIIVINKPHNTVVHPGAGNINNTLLNALLHYYPPIANVPRAGIVHRLDKDTTGLMVVAKNIHAQINLIKSLQKHEIIREYEALIVGHILENGIIEQPIKRHPIKRTYMSVHPSGKPAITYYRILEHFRKHTSLRIRLKTGRTHQIRVHMSYISHPLVGDQIYGRRHRHLKATSKELISALNKFNRQALHATMLNLDHPVNNIKMEWNVPLPQDMAELISIMRNDLLETENK